MDKKMRQRIKELRIKEQQIKEQLIKESRGELRDVIAKMVAGVSEFPPVLYLGIENIDPETNQMCIFGVSEA